MDKKNAAGDESLVTMRWLAAQVNICIRSLQRLFYDGRLPLRPIRFGRSLRFRRQDALVWISNYCPLQESRGD